MVFLCLFRFLFSIHVRIQKGISVQKFKYIVNAVKHKVGRLLVRSAFKHTKRGLSGKNKNREKSGTLSESYVRVKPVADKRYLRYLKAAYTAEHVGALLVRFPEKAGFYSCGKLYRGAYRPTVRYKAACGWTVDVRVGGIKQCAVSYKRAGVLKLFVGKGGVKA